MTHWKSSDAGKDWGQKEKRAKENEIAGQYHQWNEHELGQTPGDGEGQGGLVCCSPWGHKESGTAGRMNDDEKNTLTVNSPAFASPNLPGCLDWFRGRHVTQAGPRELAMECLLGHLEKEMLWVVKLEEWMTGTSGGHPGGKPSDTEGYQHYIKQSWRMVILMISLQHLDPGVPEAKSDLEMFNYVSWLFCRFPKASWSWIQSTLESNQNNPNTSSLYKWGNGVQRGKGSYPLVFELEQTQGFCTLLENLSSRCLPQSRPWESPVALLSPLFHTLLLVNHPAFSTDQLSFHIPPIHPISDLLKWLLVSLSLPSSSLLSVSYSEVPESQPHWSHDSAFHLVPVLMIQNTEGRFPSLSQCQPFPALASLRSVLRLPKHQ